MSKLGSAANVRLARLFFACWLLYVSVGGLWLVFKPELRSLLTAGPDGLMVAFDGMDAGWYVEGGQALASNSISASNVWILKLWPPGMVHIYALIFSSGVSPGISLLILSSAVFAFACVMIFSLLEARYSRSKAYAGLTFALLNPYAILSLHPERLFFSDGIGAALAAICVVSLVMWLKQIKDVQPNEPLLPVGLVFALSSVLALSLRWALLPAVFVLWCTAAATAITIIRSGSSWSPSFVPGRLQQVRRAGVVAFMAALPWSLFSAVVLNPPSPSWSSGTGYLWSQRWLPDSALPGFLVDGNSNWACDIDPPKCAELSPLAAAGQTPADVFFFATLESTLTNPLAFVAVRTPDFVRGWFAIPYAPVGSFELWGLGAVALALLLLSLVIGGKPTLRADLTILLAWTIVNFAVLSLFNIESRYFLPIQWVSFCLAPLFLLSFWREPTPGHRTLNSAETDNRP